MSERLFKNLKPGFKAYTFLNKLRQCGRYTDLKIEVEGGLHVNAHRAVLAERLPFLVNMLASATNEGGVFHLAWPRFPKSIVEAMVSYIYEGTVTLNENNVERLYLLAFTTDCDQLLQWCVEFMGSTFTNGKLQSYLAVGRAVASDEFYRMICSNIFENNLLEAFNEKEVLRFLRMSSDSNDRKLEMISVWGESNKDIFDKTDSILDIFTRFLRHIDATNLSRSAIDKFLLGDDLFGSNHNCRQYLKVLSSYSSPQTLMVYGMSRDDNNMAISAVMELTEDNQQIVKVRFPYNFERRATSLNGTVYVLGAVDIEIQRLTTVTEINLESGVVSEGPPMLTPRSWFAVAISSVEIFVCGGYTKEGALSSCERSRPAESPSWSAMPSLVQKRDSAAAVVLGGDQQLLVTGGRDGSDTWSSVELLNLQPHQSLKWITVAPMLHSRSSHDVCLFRGRVVSAGGWQHGWAVLNSVEMFSPPQTTGDLGQWTELQPLSQLEGPVSLAFWKGRLLVFGRFTRRTEELIDPRHDRTNNLTDEILPQFTWRPVGDLSQNMDSVEDAFVVQRKTNSIT